MPLMLLFNIAPESIDAIINTVPLDETVNFS